MLLAAGVAGQRHYKAVRRLQYHGSHNYHQKPPVLKMPLNHDSGLDNLPSSKAAPTIAKPIESHELSSDNEPSSYLTGARDRGMQRAYLTSADLTWNGEGTVRAFRGCDYNAPCFLRPKLQESRVRPGWGTETLPPSSQGECMCHKERAAACTPAGGALHGAFPQSQG